jgi:hypothetical protein
MQPSASRQMPSGPTPSAQTRRFDNDAGSRLVTARATRDQLAAEVERLRVDNQRRRARVDLTTQASVCRRATQPVADADWVAHPAPLHEWDRLDPNDPS